MGPSRTFQSIGFTSGRVDSDENFARLWLRTRRIFVVLRLPVRQ